MAILQTMKATDGTNSYYFRSVADSYSGLDTTLGVKAAEAADLDNPLYKVEELQGKGLVFRLTCSLENGKRVELMCVRSKLQTALDELPGKNAAGSKIKSAVLSRKTRFF